MNYRRDQRLSRTALFDDIEEGGVRGSSHSRDAVEHGNEKAIESLHYRASFLKRLTGDIHDEVESHNHMLSRMGNDMDASEEFCMEPWLTLNRCLRRNQIKECASL